MYLKLPLGDLNFSSCPHPTSTYTCGIIIKPRVCGGDYRFDDTLTSISPKRNTPYILIVLIG